MAHRYKIHNMGKAIFIKDEFIHWNLLGTLTLYLIPLFGFNIFGQHFHPGPGWILFWILFLILLTRFQLHDHLKSPSFKLAFKEVGWEIPSSLSLYRVVWWWWWWWRWWWWWWWWWSIDYGDDFHICIYTAYMHMLLVLLVSLKERILWKMKNRLKVGKVWALKQ